jgi:hypothetical protein
VSRAAAPLVLDPGQRELLESLAKSRTAAHRLVQRARVLLHAADGCPTPISPCSPVEGGYSYPALFADHGSLRQPRWGGSRGLRGRWVSRPLEPCGVRTNFAGDLAESGLTLRARGGRRRTRGADDEQDGRYPILSVILVLSGLDARAVGRPWWKR